MNLSNKIEEWEQIPNSCEECPFYSTTEHHAMFSERWDGPMCNMDFI